jgi:hypothetical protein
VTKAKANPAKRGPKPRPPEERVEQLTIRLAPKLKLGLELLARAQGRSLSQAVEWALQVGLNTYRVNSEGLSVAELLETAWEKPAVFDRMEITYLAAPSLLSFEDRATCELLIESREAISVSEQIDVGGPPWSALSPQEQSDRIRTAGEWRKQRQEIFQEFARAFWPTFSEIALARTVAGKSLTNCSLLNLMAPELMIPTVDEYAVMQTLADIRNGKVDKASFSARVMELDEQLPWTRMAQKLKQRAAPSEPESKPAQVEKPRKSKKPADAPLPHPR